MSEIIDRAPDCLNGLFGIDLGEPVPEVLTYECDVVYVAKPFNHIDPNDTRGLRVVSGKYTTEEMLELCKRGQLGGWVGRNEDGEVFWQQEVVVNEQ